MIRFLFIWGIISAISYLLMFFFSKQDRKTIRSIAWKIILSMLIGSLFVLPLFLINNLSGI